MTDINDDMEELLGNITVDSPVDRAETLRVFPDHAWPEGFWGVSDDVDGYIAFFQHEADAWAFRLLLVNARMNVGDISKRYRTKK